MPEQGKAGIHHTKPLVMPRKIFSLFANDLAKPFSHLRTVYIVVINPVLIAGIVRRIDINTFDLPGVVREKGFKGEKIIAFHKQITAPRIAHR
jgi:hypothetical protein